MPPSKTDTHGNERICSDCVGDAVLKARIRSSAAHDYCFYCGEKSATISVADLADNIELAFDTHYERTPDQADGWELAVHGDLWERDGESATWAIVNAADVSEDIGEDVRSVLEDRHHDFDLYTMGEECPLAKESQYSEKHAGHGEFAMLWNEFETGLKTQTRFFSRSAKSILVVSNF